MTIFQRLNFLNLWDWGRLCANTSFKPGEQPKMRVIFERNQQWSQ